MAGFSGAEADDLRKAIGKKKRDLMATMKDKFMQGLAESGTATSVAKDLWKLNEAAADYSFNKSHAACYGLISYRTAYLKANYPAEYMAAVISSVMNTKDKVPFFVNRCAEMGIDVLPPDVNSSDHSFVVSEKAIRFGLDAVKNVGHAAVEAILRAREDAPIASIWDFCERVDSRAVNKRAIECLVKCGALDSTGATRKGMLEALPAAQSAGQKAQEDAQLGQGSIFDFGDAAASGGGGGASSSHHRPPISAAEFERRELLAMEKETLGTYLSSHPLSEVREALRARVDCSLAELASKPDGAWVTVGGIVAESKKIRTKSGSQMMFATLDDVEGQVEMLVFKADQAESAGGDRDRRRRPRPRPDRPQGAGRDEARRAGGRAVRTRRRGDRPGQRRGERAGGAAAADDRRGEPRQPASDRGTEDGFRGPQGRRRGLPGDPRRGRQGPRVEARRGVQGSPLEQAAGGVGPRPGRRRPGCLDFCCARYAPEDR